MKKVVFLDRDGVINKYPGDKKYVTSLKGFSFLPGVKPALRELSKAGCSIFVISNQAGVAKGVFTKNRLDLITKRMVNELGRYQVKFQGIYYCTHHPDADCPCRKPKDGLLQIAVKEHRISKQALARAFFVGDTIRDVLAAKKAGCKSILVFSGKEKAKNRDNWQISPDFTAEGLSAASEIILKKFSLLKTN